MTLEDQLQASNSYFESIARAVEDGETERPFMGRPNNDIYYYDFEMKKWYNTGIKSNETNDTDVAIEDWLKNFKK